MVTALDSLLAKTQGNKPAAKGSPASAGGNALTSMLSQVQGKKYQSQDNAYSTQPPTSPTPTAPVSMGSKITEFVSSAQNAAKKLIPQLGQPQNESAPITREVPKNLPAIPKDLKVNQSLFDFNTNEPTVSAQLTDQAKSDVQQGLKTFKETPTGKAISKAGNILDAFGDTLKQEQKRVQRDLNALAENGIVQPAYAPADRETAVKSLAEPEIKQLVTNWDNNQSLGKRISKMTGLVLVGNVEGLTGGLVKAQNVEPTTTEGKIAYGVAKTLGSVVSMRKIAAVFDGLASGSTTVSNFIEKYPKAAPQIVNWAKNVLAFDVYGQLDPDTQKRFQKLALDSATGTLFSMLGGIKQGIISIPANFAVGYGLAKWSGASNEDAFIAGGILSVLDATQRGSKFAFETQLKGKAGTIRFTPEEASAQVKNTNLRGTEAGRVMEEAALKAKVQNKDLQIEVITGKVSSRAQDILGIKTPKGISFKIELVDPAPRQARVSAPASETPVENAPADASNAPMSLAIKPTAESSGFAVATAAKAPPTLATPIIPPVAEAAPMTPENRPISAQPTAQELKTVNKTFNRQTAIKTSVDTLEGKREDQRLSDPKNIRKVASALGVENPTPDTMVKLYRGGSTNIKPGDFVTTDLNLAHKYVSERTDAKIFTKDVPVKDLVMSGGLKKEFIYAPQSAVTSLNPGVDSQSSETDPSTLDEKAVFDMVKERYRFAVQRGDSISSIMSGQQGGTLDAKRSFYTTGNYLNGKKLKSDQVGVELGDGREFIFKLKDIIKDLQGKPVEKIKTEKKTVQKETPQGENANQKYLKDYFEKNLRSATSAQIKTALEHTRKPISVVDAPEIISKVGSAAKAISLKELETRPALLYGGISRGVFTDGFILVVDKSAAKRINDLIIEKKTAQIEKLYLKEGMTAVAARKAAASDVQEKIDQYKKETYPPYEKILPTEIGKEVTIQGINQNGQVIVTDGTDQTAIDVDKLAFIQKQFPNATLHMLSPLKPIEVVENKKISAVVMPMRLNMEDLRVFEPSFGLKKTEQNVPKSAVSKKNDQSTDSEALKVLKHQIGDTFTVVEPVGSLWKPKGNTIFIQPVKENPGFARWLKGKNFIENVQEAGNNIYQVEVKVDTAPVSRATKNSGSMKANKEAFTEALPRGEKTTTETVRIIEFPEMVKMAREMLGDNLVVKKLKPSLRGYFSPVYQKIVLNRDIFKSEMQVARTLAHEIGHLVDFLGATGNTMKRGNLLGRLATLNSYRKFFISSRPPATENLITAADRKRLMKEARELAKQPNEVTEEVVVGTKKVTPKEILDIWRDTAIGIKNPELVRYIQTLTNRQKAEIARAAMNNTVLPWVDFMNSIKETVTHKVIKSAPADVKAIFKKKLEEEIQKRHLVSLQIIREELKKLSYAWRPLDVKSASKSHLQYRNSGEELYADAISVLFNDPLRLQQDAPVFYKTFFNYLENKPAASEAFFDAWHLLNKGEDAVLASRLESIDQMFKNDEAKFTALLLERNKVKRDIGFELKYELIDKNQKILDKVKEAQKRGVIVPDDENPKYLLDGYNYMAGKIKAMLEEDINPWYSKLADQGLSWEHVGKMMLLERIIAERTEIANPLGLTKSTAKPTRDQMIKELGEEKAKALTEAITEYRKLIKKVAKDAYTRGQLYGEELYKQMESNEVYAAFRVTDYIEKSVTAKVYKQVGTLKDIGNPATSTLAKLIATMRATERAVTNRAVVDFMKKNFAGEIELAKTRWNGRRQVPIEPDDGRGLIYNMEQGKAVGYYVDKYIADAVDFSGIQNMNILMKAFQVSNAKVFRPLFIGINLGFQIRNFRRDFVRVYKATPDLNPGKIIANYIRALPAAKARALGYNNKTIIAMERSGMLATTYNDVIQGRSEEDKQIDDLINKYITKSEDASKNPVVHAVKSVLGGIETLGNFIETLPKVAGYYQMADRLDPQQLADFVRTKAGSPDFLRRGNSYQATNNVFLFSNAMKEGVRGDYEAFTDPKTASGYWFKTFLIDFLPKILMKAAQLGAFGTLVKRMYDNMSEYTKTNYNPIAIGIDANGKTMYLMNGSDETGAMFGGLFWKFLNINTNKSIEQGVMDILAYAGGRIPGLSPAINLFDVAAQYLQGLNPYDTYRNRNIVSEKEFDAGGMYRFMPVAAWMFQQAGGSLFLGSTVVENTGNYTALEKVINLPVASNILQSIIRVSDYGQVELNKAVGQQVKKEKAILRIEDGKKIDSAVERVRNGENQISVERSLADQIKGNSKMTPDIESRITSARNQFKLSMIKQKNDPNINSLIYATSNQEKAAILNRISESLSPADFDAFRREALVNKVISPEVIMLWKNGGK